MINPIIRQPTANEVTAAKHSIWDTMKAMRVFPCKFCGGTDGDVSGTRIANLSWIDNDGYIAYAQEQRECWHFLDEDKDD